VKRDQLQKEYRPMEDSTSRNGTQAAAGESRLVAQQDLLNLDAAKHFLRGMLARLDDDDEITLETGDEDPRRWTPTVRELLDGDLDAVLEELPADVRLYVANWSGERVIALATKDAVEP
jgi:hypothetical protein